MRRRWELLAQGEERSHAEGMCLAPQLLSALRRSGPGREAVRSPHAAAAVKDRHPRLRLPGCTRPAWDREGACSFHHLVCWGLIEE